MEKNILIKIAYDGHCYFGWQRQEGLPTVQGSLEEALSKALGEDIRIHGTGRTDRGVHSLGQCATFVTSSRIPVEKIGEVVNRHLAKAKLPQGQVAGDIKVIWAKEVEKGFHARFSAKGKTYKYILSTRDANPFEINYKYFIQEGFDFEEAKKACSHLVGTHDFEAFQSAGGTPRETTVRTIFSADLCKDKDDYIFYVKGDGFLYNMVRIIVGTLVDVGMGKFRADDLKEIINSRKRERAGHTAPACGLYLEEVYFTEEELRRERTKL